MLRSRTDFKYDQSYVEQNNFQYVRSLFGYTRLYSPIFVKNMNEILSKLLKSFSELFYSKSEIKLNRMNRF